jgi:hypothetical protein
MIFARVVQAAAWHDVKGFANAVAFQRKLVLYIPTFSSLSLPCSFCVCSRLRYIRIRHFDENQDCLDTKATLLR